MELRDRIKRYLEENGVSQNRFAKTIGVNGAYLSRYLEEGSGYRYAGKIEGPAAKYIDNCSTKTQEGVREPIPFIVTRDVNNAFFVIDDAVDIGKIAVITGTPGCGKTRTIREYVQERPNAVLIEATIRTRGKELFEMIAKRLGVKTLASQDAMVRECAEELTRSEKFFIVDEAEHLSYAALELLRRLHDFSGRALILVGTEQLVDNLRGAKSSTRKAREYRQLSSRIVGKYEFKGLAYKREVAEKIVEEQKDLIAYCEALGVKNTGAIKTTKLLARGNVRKIENLLERAKRLARISNAQIDAELIKEASAMVFLD
ncbi:MAG: AAA family ATPase [Campylobacteraceae bacterium]|jgi:DNA transposition AAA+ family ATPase|nr:AAA family ATPase [Campylobacteraceae bacterium]